MFDFRNKFSSTRLIHIEEIERVFQLFFRFPASEFDSIRPGQALDCAGARSAQGARHRLIVRVNRGVLLENTDR